MLEQNLRRSSKAMSPWCDAKQWSRLDFRSDTERYSAFFFSCAITNYDNFYTLLAQRTDEKRYYKQSNLLATERQGLYYCSNAKQSIHPFSF